MSAPASRRVSFGLFFLSGFSGLVYQLVWLRLAFASFGVVTPVISVVLSVFMFGLGVGSWLSGMVVRRWPWPRGVAWRAYAAAEVMIGAGGIAVPLLFAWGARSLLPTGEADSVQYLTLSAGVIALSLAPFCLAMGSTFPLMLQALRAEREDPDGFSYLYLANVLGAMAGTLLTPVMLVELLGFRGTLAIAVIANWSVAIISLRMSFATGGQPGPATDRRPLSVAADAAAATSGRPRSNLPLWILFTTGLASMGMEIVWARAFMPVLKTQVYSFAGLLWTYLLATWCGSALYRWRLRQGRVASTSALLSLLSLVAFGQLLQADPRVALPGEWLQAGWLLLGIVPYCAVLGYLTPKLIDEWSLGAPGPAGSAYAINVLGCILGPVLASYVLLPRLGVQWSGVLLGLPLWGLAARSLVGDSARAANAVSPDAASAGISAPSTGRQPRGLLWSALVLGVVAAVIGTSYEELEAARGGIVYRDHTATVIATRAEDGGKLLLVNGKPITSITPTTKLMAHLPLCYLTHEPQSALVICFGMGTTYRSLLSWDIDATAVELVPSVRDAFGYFFEDAEEIRRHPRGTIVIDDGRRFLQRTTQTYDVITLDPPPPPEAAASSLLYSREFYQLVKPRLSEGGILHQWFPGGEFLTLQALLRSVAEEFPHVQVLRAFDGWGYHILASERPLPSPSAEELAARLPEGARRDLLEWSPGVGPEALLGAIVATRFPVQQGLNRDPAIVITDDRPYNEYFLLRRLWQWWSGTYTIAL